MPTLGNVTRRFVAKQETLRGDVTFINGQQLNGDWVPADPKRVQQYLKDEEWGIPAYDVTFPASALDAPYNLAYGSKVQWQVPGQSKPWNGEVRRCDPITVSQTATAILALVVLYTAS